MNGQNYIDKVYQHLLINETITPEEAMRLYGITRLSSCISELRKKGYEIITETFSKIHENGRKYNHGMYKLIKK